ncbi:hypothetical protein C6W92_16055 [Roseovarius sp. A46]|nr:hypothetical protein C6W92_16055 [Roseovarius sp. A46]
MNAALRGGVRGLHQRHINTRPEKPHQDAFPPLEVLHYLLITLRLGRLFKGEFRLTKRGAELARAPPCLMMNACCASDNVDAFM